MKQLNEDRDERGGLISASELARLAECPGSFSLSREVSRAIHDDDSSSRIAGRRMHHAFADLLPLSELNYEEAGIILNAREIVTRYLEQWKKDFELETIEKEMKEDRLWFCDPNGNPVFSGAFDVAFISGRNGLVLDLKTLWGDHPPPDQNLQLRGYAVLLSHKFDLKHVRVGLIQPAYEMNPPCDYDQVDLQHAEREVLSIISRALNEDVRNPNQYCKWCRALYRCPEAHQQLNLVINRTSAHDLTILSNDDLSSLMDKCGTVEAVLSEIKKETKKRLRDNPNAIPSWFLTRPRKLMKINDPVKAHEICGTYGLSDEAFLSQVKISLTGIVRLLSKKSKINPKIVRKDVEEALADGLTVSYTEESLKRKAI